MGWWLRQKWDSLCYIMMQITHMVLYSSQLILYGASLKIRCFLGQNMVLQRPNWRRKVTGMTLEEGNWCDAGWVVCCCWSSTVLPRKYGASLVEEQCFCGQSRRGRSLVWYWRRVTVTLDEWCAAADPVRCFLDSTVFSVCMGVQQVVIAGLLGSQQVVVTTQNIYLVVVAMVAVEELCH